MKQRLWSRLYRSSYRKPRPFTSIYIWMYLAVYCIYLGLQIGIFHYGKVLADYVLEYILLGVISLAAGWISPLFGWFVRALVLEFYAFLYIFFILNLYQRAIHYLRHLFSTTEPTMYTPLGCAAVGLVMLTIVNWIFYPVVLRAWYSIAGTLSPKVEVSQGESGEYRYEITQLHTCIAPYRAIYEGPIHNGLPHGLGTWFDTSYQGELLRGYWRHGIPIGPFESLENDTRNMLVNLRIIYGTNSGGKWWLNRTPLSVGVASVETCVSGNFFKGYPIVTMLAGPTIAKNFDAVKDVFQKKLYRHIEDDSIVVRSALSHILASGSALPFDQKHKRLQITGFRSTNQRPTSVTIRLDSFAPSKSASKPATPFTPSTPGLHRSTSVRPAAGIQSLKLDNSWSPSGGSEGILFIHGVNHNLEDMLKRFGQFLALGHFPPYIKPFCFNWPASTNPLFYWCASSSASNNDVHRDLRRFIKMLARAGITTLHIMCHSMGSRFFLRGFSTIKEMFKRRLYQKPVNSSFSDYSQTTFLDDLGEVLPDLDDDKGVEEKITLQNVILMNPDYETDTFLNDYWDLQMYTPNITIYADSRDTPLRVANTVANIRSLGLEFTQRKRLSEYLDKMNEDLDLIDTSDLDRNMNSQFHGYFNINRAMVDDLRELIVTGKRADERTSRLKLFGGVYRFTIVPSSVVMV